MSFTHLSPDGTAQPQLDQAFGYDENDRLTAITTQAASWSISYDANGNRTGMSLNGSPSSYAVEATSNRITGISNPARSIGFDAAGNTTSDSSGYTATYNLRGQLETITRAGVTTTYTYNAAGQRVRKASSTGSVVHFVYDLAGHLLGEYDGQGVALREYVWLRDTPVAMFTPDPANPTGAALVYYIHTDHLDAPRIVVDRNNQTRWRWLSEPFGTTAPETNPQGLGDFTQNLRFPGQYADAESGLWYNHHRYYGATEGRYTQSDPIGLSGGGNTYVYVDGSPLKFSDPLGLAKIVGRPNGFSEGIAWARKYKELFEYNEWARKEIISKCNDGGKTLARFDNWIIRIDPNIDNLLRRARTNFAVTSFGTQTTQFNWAFFNREPLDPGPGLIFMHEFRHLMPENQALVSAFSVGAAIVQDLSSPVEVDADAWAKKFLSGDCSCKK